MHDDRVGLTAHFSRHSRAAGAKGPPRQVVETALRLDFPADEAEKQVDTAIEWGRYAEALTYDDQDGRLFLG